jgi:chromosome partitioning protein
MSAIIVSVVNQKGGCGKTQTAMQLGGELALRGNRVLIVDMDLQGTASIWASNSDADRPFPATVISLAKFHDKLIQGLRQHVENYDCIIIDCPPVIQSSIPWHALCASHIGIIPVMPSGDNIWALHEVEVLCKRAQAENPDLKLATIACRVPRGKIYEMYLQNLKENTFFHMLPTTLSQSIAYSESQTYGSCISMTHKKTTAAKEIKQVVDELIQFIEGN